MKFISFNINGLRARPHQLEAIIEKHQPDIIGLQEIKVSDEDFPYDLINHLGYQRIPSWAKRALRSGSFNQKTNRLRCVKVFQLIAKMHKNE